MRFCSLESAFKIPDGYTTAQPNTFEDTYENRIEQLLPSSIQPPQPLQHIPQSIQPINCNSIAEHLVNCVECANKYRRDSTITEKFNGVTGNSNNNVIIMLLIIALVWIMYNV